MSRHFRVNDMLRIENIDYVLIGMHAPSDRAELICVTTESIVIHSLSRLRREHGLGKINVVGAEAARGTVGRRHESKKAIAKYQYQYAIATKLGTLTQAGNSIAEAIRKMKTTVVTLASGEIFPMCSERQAYRIAEASKTGMELLLPAYRERGNRTPRYGERMTEIVLEHVENLYAKVHSKITIASLTDIVIQSARSEGLIPPVSRVSRKYVQSVLINRASPDLDRSRLDPRVATSMKAVASKRIRPGAPLNRAEMDALHLPFLVKTRYGICTTLWLLIVIDCETSIPLGWLLLQTNPTTEDTLYCLERAIYPKEALLQKMGIAFALDPFGAMLELVWDNGSENSRTRMAGVTLVGINPTWAPAHSGHRKPFVERFNRSLKVALEILPGCTRFNNKDGMRTSQAMTDPLMSIDELEHWIVKFMFEKWPHTPLERFNNADYELDGSLGLTPVTRWKTYEAQTVLPLTPPLEKWNALRFTECKRALSHKTGISVLNYDFKGDNLAMLIGMYQSETMVPVFYDPFDFRFAYVPNKVNGEWIGLVNSEVTDATPAYSFVDAKRRKEERRNGIEPSSIASKFDEEKTNFVLEQTKKKPSRRATTKAMRGQVRLEEALTRRDKTPIVQQTQQDMPRDSHVTQDALPTFDTFQKKPRVPDGR